FYQMLNFSTIIANFLRKIQIMKFLNNYCQKGTFSMNFSTISFFSKCFQRSSSSGFLITCSFLIYFFPPYQLNTTFEWSNNILAFKIKAK
ncbi:MAG TPA: hypothetical protein PL139_09175, partial [Candidatus Cloacimonadota bacterium]|nr:hypothetical protein [Candidatus Cloacimonadota bacterium]